MGIGAEFFFVLGSFLKDAIHGPYMVGITRSTMQVAQQAAHKNASLRCGAKFRCGNIVVNKHPKPYPS